MRSDHLSKHLKTHLTKKNLTAADISDEMVDDVSHENCDLSMSVDIEQEVNVNVNLLKSECLQMSEVKQSPTMN